MAAHADTTLRNTWVAAIETRAGASPLFRFRTGTAPATAAAASTGTLLASIVMSADWLAAPSGGSAALQGTLSVAAVATGTVGNWELMDSTGTTCILRDNIGSGVSLDTNIISAIGQIVLISGTFAAGNA